MNNNPFSGSAHRDVLDAVPTTPEETKKLVEEIKNRGRGAVMASAFPDAALLYQKGIDIITTTTSSSTAATTTSSSTTTAASTTSTTKEDLAILYANLSLVQRNMGELEKARRSASSATQADATYVKGWWRLGQALQSLHRTTEALEAFQKALELEPQNKALLKECQVLTKKLEEEQALLSLDIDDDNNNKNNNRMMIDEDDDPSPEEKKKKSTTTKSSSSSKPVSNSSTASTNGSASSSSTTIPSTKSSSSSTSTKDTVVVMEDDDNIFTKSDFVKGYKTVNGKKTSYFHKELSEEEKRLIGDIAPKKLEDTTTTTDTSTTPTTTTTKSGASAWNQAGTWEERDVTTWAQETLQQQLLKATFTFPASSPAPGAIASITSVTNLTGHASFAMVARGKKRYIYEFSAKLQWQLILSGGDDNGSDGGDGSAAADAIAADCSGTMSFPDIDGTCELGDGYEMVDYTVDTAPNDSSVTPLLDRFVKNGGLRESIHTQIDDWVRLFRQTY